MNVDRLRREVDDLNDSWPVKWSVDNQYVMISHFRYPKGWSPRTAPLFFSIPDDYPASPPDVYVPPDIRYEGSKVTRMRGPNDDGWWKWCIVKLGWDPEKFDLRTLTELMRTSLAEPRNKTPVRSKAKGGESSESVSSLFNA